MVRETCKSLHSLFTDLDQSSEMIIFESILTTFIASVVLRGLKLNHQKQVKLAWIGETHCST